MAQPGGNQFAGAVFPGQHGPVVPRVITSWNDLHIFERGIADDIIWHAAQANGYSLPGPDSIPNNIRHILFNAVFDMWTSEEDIGTKPVFRDAHGMTLRNSSYLCGTLRVNADVTKTHRQAGALVYCRAQRGAIFPSWRFIDARGQLVPQNLVALRADLPTVLASSCIRFDAGELRLTRSYNLALAVFWTRQRVAHIAQGYAGPVPQQDCNFAELRVYESLFDTLVTFRQAIEEMQEQHQAQTANMQPL